MVTTTRAFKCVYIIIADEDFNWLVRIHVYSCITSYLDSPLLEMCANSLTIPKKKTLLKSQHSPKSDKNVLKISLILYC